MSKKNEVELDAKSPYQIHKEKHRTPSYVQEDALRVNTIKESFSWMSPEWSKAGQSSKKRVRAKVIALRSDIVSRNNRRYIDEELKMAARTLAGKPVTINHIDKQIVGHCIHGEYENSQLECLIEVNKEPYVGYIREKNPIVKGVSVQAGYIHNRCTRCGEKFYSEKAFKQHMNETHGILDGIEEVHGIVFDALSLVCGSETPGVPDTSIELMETFCEPMKLFETVLHGHGVVALTSSGGFKLREPEDSHGCNQETEYWDEATGKCLPKTEAEETEDEEPKDVETPVESDVPDCGEGKVYNPVTKQCEAIEDVVTEGRLGEIFIKGTKTQLKAIYEAILDKVQHSFNAYKEQVNEKVLKEMEEVKATLVALQPHILEMAMKKPVLQETQGLTERLQKLEVRADNYEAKLKGTFKGHQKQLIKSEGPELDSKGPYEK